MVTLTKNPCAASLTALSWKGPDAERSLQILREYAEAEAQRQIDWYHARKPDTLSSRMRLAAILFGALGGLLPLLKATLPPAAAAGLANYAGISEAGYFSLALAVAIFQLDRYFGVSTSWMRYVTAAAAIEKSLEEYRMEWANLTAQLQGAPPAAPQLHQLIACTTNFSLAVKSHVEQETRAWVVEFQSNLAQLDGELKARAKEVREQVQAANRTENFGAISLTVSNGASTDAGFDVELDGNRVEEGVTGARCAIFPAAAGLHRIRVTATVAGRAAAACDIVEVTAGAVARPSFELALSKAEK
jgi:hypothetical protein